MDRLRLLNRKTGKLAKLLSPEATRLVVDTIESIYKLEVHEQMDTVVAVLLSYVALERERRKAV